MIDVAKRLVSANVSRFTPTRSWRLVADKRVRHGIGFCYQYQRPIVQFQYHTMDLQSRILLTGFKANSILPHSRIILYIKLFCKYYSIQVSRRSKK